jgi:hypothetical protein
VLLLRRDRYGEWIVLVELGEHHGEAPSEE